MPYLIGFRYLNKLNPSLCNRKGFVVRHSANINKQYCGKLLYALKHMLKTKATLTTLYTTNPYSAD